MYTLGNIEGYTSLHICIYTYMCLCEGVYAIYEYICIMCICVCAKVCMHICNICIYMSTYVYVFM